MHKPPSNKTSKVQEIVSEALHLAETQSFEAGLRHLKNSGNSRFQDEHTNQWFAHKCVEHNIKLPLLTADL